MANVQLAGVVFGAAHAWSPEMARLFFKVVIALVVLIVAIRISFAYLGELVAGTVWQENTAVASVEACGSVNNTMAKG